MIKRLVKWLAHISGAEADIRQLERGDIAMRIKSTSFWFTNHTKYGKLYPFLIYISYTIKHGYYVNGDTTRETWDRLQTAEGLYESASGWKEFNYNYTTGRLEFKGEGDWEE